MVCSLSHFSACLGVPWFWKNIYFPTCPQSTDLISTHGSTLIRKEKRTDLTIMVQRLAPFHSCPGTSCLRIYEKIFLWPSLFNSCYCCVNDSIQLKSNVLILGASSALLLCLSSYCSLWTIMSILKARAHMWEGWDKSQTNTQATFSSN